MCKLNRQLFSLNNNFSLAHGNFQLFFLLSSTWYISKRKQSAEEKPPYFIESNIFQTSTDATVIDIILFLEITCF